MPKRTRKKMRQRLNQKLKVFERNIQKRAQTIRRVADERQLLTGFTKQLSMSEAKPEDWTEPAKPKFINVLFKIYGGTGSYMQFYLNTAGDKKTFDTFRRLSERAWEMEKDIMTQKDRVRIRENGFQTMKKMNFDMDDAKLIVNAALMEILTYFSAVDGKDYKGEFVNLWKRLRRMGKIAEGEINMLSWKAWEVKNEEGDGDAQMKNVEKVETEAE